MGEIADMMLDGTLDCHTGEYLGKPCGYPRTAQRKTREEIVADRQKHEIRKEIAMLTKELISQGIAPNVALHDARHAMNVKYGKGWRENG